MKKIMATILAIGLTACSVTELKPNADAVRVTTNPEVIKGCKYIAEIAASDRFYGGVLGQDLAEENMYRKIKNSAVKLGANVVYLNRAHTGLDGASGRGEAYFCETQ